ncbi:helix-turn-helix domain-containing protein [Hellea balneolensis]|uniref:helix-turn-helix domain-containing protein n=1 Tax=Hellea balneolensis TaxID=287478 RepID=UPI0004003383|nr:helix-turn-helix domain-containing protein [Hellea balneolensis]
MPHKNKNPLIMDKTCARLVVSAVAMEFAVPGFVLSSRFKGKSEVSYARQIAMYLMCCVYGLTKQRIAEVFERHYTTVSHACRLIEDQRDDPVFDAKLLKLENFLGQAPLPSADNFKESELC